jgi:hypothetical protein
VAWSQPCARSSTSGGRPEASILGFGGRASAIMAALPTGRWRIAWTMATKRRGGSMPPALSSGLRSLSRSGRFPLWVSPAGSVHDITAARLHALPALYPAAAAGLPALADPGYDGAGIGIHIPVRHPADGRDLESIRAPATPCSVPSAASGNADSRCSPAAGAPCSTSPPALQDRRYRPGCARPDPFRVWLHQMKS